MSTMRIQETVRSATHFPGISIPQNLSLLDVASGFLRGPHPESPHCHLEKII
jgi:hypothetical protein